VPSTTTCQQASASCAAGRTRWTCIPDQMPAQHHQQREHKFDEHASSRFKHHTSHGDDASPIPPACELNKRRGAKPDQAQSNHGQQTGGHNKGVRSKQPEPGCDEVARDVWLFLNWSVGAK
jgi:hypothetical protein